MGEEREKGRVEKEESKGGREKRMGWRLEKGL